nr:Chain k, 1A9L SS [Escherichia coli]5GAF_k Chain k, 1A9L SS [Escherichia coli]5GAG_k Chain k, 1A9L SS [Escherichia coli]5GAH_k Chain k, 1A9L SS [Escherichia coli]
MKQSTLALLLLLLLLTPV